MKSEALSKEVTVMKGTKMNQNLSNQNWYTLAEAKEYTRLSESLLRQAIAKGRLKTARSSENGGKLLFRREWLDEMILKGLTHD
jgi:excisionase family DNA binding protein